MIFSIQEETPLNRYALNMWIGLALMFLLWWIFQLSLYWTKMREWRPSYERIVQEEIMESPSWITRLSNASNVARDSFLFLFALTFLCSAVHVTATMASLTWIYVALSLIWQFTSLSSVNPNIHVLFLLLTSPFLIAIGTIGLTHG